MSVLSLAIRLRMNFTSRTLDSPDPDVVLGRLAEATRRAGRGELPSYFRHLRIRPHVLAGQAAITHRLVADPGMALETVLRTGYLTSRLNNDCEAVEEFGKLLRDAGVALEPLERAAAGDDTRDAILRFTYDVTRWADRTTDDEVVALRRIGLGDRELLSLVLIVASFNAANRMSRAFGVGSASRPRPTNKR